MAKTQLSQTFAGQVSCEKSRNQRVTSVDNVVIGLVILNALEIETQISLLGQMTIVSIMVVERIGQFGVFPQCSNLREHSVCKNFVSNFRCSPVDAHIPISPVVTGTVHPTRSADFQKFVVL